MKFKIIITLILLSNPLLSFSDDGEEKTNYYRIKQTTKFQDTSGRNFFMPKHSTNKVYAVISGKPTYKRVNGKLVKDKATVTFVDQNHKPYYNNKSFTIDYSTLMQKQTAIDESARLAALTLPEFENKNTSKELDPPKHCTQSTGNSNENKNESEKDNDENSSNLDIGESTLAAEGARKVLASIFQSCKAIEEPITPETSPQNASGVKSADYNKNHVGKERKFTDKSTYIETHPVLKILNDDSSYPTDGCYDATEVPPVYAYGSKAKPSGNNEWSLDQAGPGVIPSSAEASGIDCSGMISLALGSQGLKFTTNEKNYSQRSTTGFNDLLGKSNSCLKHAPFSGSTTILAGDMVNTKKGHIIMIDSVGDDPFGIKKVKSEGGSCNDISVVDFDFTYIHSGPAKGNIGPSRVEAKAGGTGHIDKLLVVAREACEKGNQEYSSEKISNSANLGSKSFSIIRHDSENSDCISDQKQKIQGESCIKQCTEDIEGNNE